MLSKIFEYQHRVANIPPSAPADELARVRGELAEAKEAASHNQGQADRWAKGVAEVCQANELLRTRLAQFDAAMPEVVHAMERAIQSIEYLGGKGNGCWTDGQAALLKLKSLLPPSTPSGLYLASEALIAAKKHKEGV